MLPWEQEDRVISVAVEDLEADSFCWLTSTQPEVEKSLSLRRVTTSTLQLVFVMELACDGSVPGAS